MRKQLNFLLSLILFLLFWSCEEAAKENSLEVKYENNANRCIVYWRVDNDEKVVVALNLDSNVHTIDLEFPEPGSWSEYLSDSDINIESNFFGGYTLAPLTSYVFIPKDETPSCTAGDINRDDVINVVDIISSAMPLAALQIILAVAGAMIIASSSKAKLTCFKPPEGLSGNKLVKTSLLDNAAKLAFPTNCSAELLIIT